MSRPFDLVVFDWDGTLLDSAAHIVACVQAAAAHLGWEPRNDAAVRNIIGLGLIEACTVLYPEYAPGDYGRLAEAYKQQFFSESREPILLFEGAIEVLTSLKDQGYLLAVATGKSRFGFEHSLEETGLRDLLDTSRCADETASKPHPQMLLEIMEELNVDTRRAVMIGDTEYDLAMARNAGVRAIGAGYGAHTAARLLTFNPLACLSAIAELPGILKTIPPGKGVRRQS